MSEIGSPQSNVLLANIKQWYTEQRRAKLEAHRDEYDCGNALFSYITGVPYPPKDDCV